jgi:transcription initiation factor IIF auxiliary subunit
MSLKTAQSFKYQGNDWWKWSVWIEGAKAELDQIEYVVYRLHPTFPNPVRTIDDRESKFCLNAHGWGTFPIQVRIVNKSGHVIKLAHDLVLEYRDGSVPTA